MIELREDDRNVLNCSSDFSIVVIIDFTTNFCHRMVTMSFVAVTIDVALYGLKLYEIDASNSWILFAISSEVRR